MSRTHNLAALARDPDLKRILTLIEAEFRELDRRQPQVDLSAVDDESRRPAPERFKGRRIFNRRNGQASISDGTQWQDILSSGVSFALPAITLSSAAGAGTTSKTIRSNAAIAAFDGTTPSAATLVAATGAANFAARVDHTHPYSEVALKTMSSVAGGDTIANTAAATSFATQFTVPANTLAVGTALRVGIRGIFGTDAIAPTLTFELVFGGAPVILASNGTTLMAPGLTNRGFWTEFDLTCTAAGAGGAIEAQGTGFFSSSATVGMIQDFENTGPVAIDTTVSQAIRGRITWGVANANNTITQRLFDVDIRVVR